MGEKDDSKRVLVVDDDTDFVRILELYLKLSGLEVSCAFCGMGALEEVRIMSPSAVILDMAMPDIDGVEVCRYIREKMGDTKTAVIALTALSGSKARRDMLQAGADEFFTKPCDFELIFKAVEQHTS